MMGKLFILIGKSASGKDAIYRRLLEDEELNLKPYVGFTTRPIRSGEMDGREYFFTDMQELERFEAVGRLIEKRIYHTVYGDWCYFTVDSDKTDLESNDYLYICTLESYIPVRDYYGEERVVPIFIQVDDGERLQRALDRERSQAEPKYAEMCRRFLADEADFAEDKIKEARISRRFNNDNLDDCVREICSYIKNS
jgi:guanylate kinase